MYLTDNSLAKHIDVLCRKNLIREARDIPIISVSQKPIKLGRNICVGEMKRGWISLYKQSLAGLNKIKTKYVAIAEHDCLYTYEHFSFIPPTDDIFYYNHSCWLVQWGGNHPELNGMYSYWPNRYAYSQLVCNRNLLKRSIEERLMLLVDDMDMDKKFLGAGEFGVMTERMIHKARRMAESGRPVALKQYLENYLAKSKSAVFHTEKPNIDIRHGTNFSGPRRGKKRRYTIPYWGEFHKLIKGR